MRSLMFTQGALVAAAALLLTACTTTTAELPPTRTPLALPTLRPSSQTILPPPTATPASTEGALAVTLAQPTATAPIPAEHALAHPAPTQAAFLDASAMQGAAGLVEAPVERTASELHPVPPQDNPASQVGLGDQVQAGAAALAESPAAAPSTQGADGDMAAGSAAAGPGDLSPPPAQIVAAPAPRPRRDLSAIQAGMVMSRTQSIVVPASGGAVFVATPTPSLTAAPPPASPATVTSEQVGTSPTAAPAFSESPAASATPVHNVELQPVPDPTIMATGAANNQ